MMIPAPPERKAGIAIDQLICDFSLLGGEVGYQGRHHDAVRELEFTMDCEGFIKLHFVPPLPIQRNHLRSAWLQE